MKSVRYKKWDGSQAPFDFKRKSVVETFLENIMKGMGPRTSLAQMMWSGFPLSGMNFRVIAEEGVVESLQEGFNMTPRGLRTLGELAFGRIYHHIKRDKQSWEGRFEAAKKVALALNHYIRSRFPKDRLHIVGFCTEARELKGSELALAQWDPGRPFTNLQFLLRPHHAATTPDMKPNR